MFATMDPESTIKLIDFHDYSQSNHTITDNPTKCVKIIYI